MTQPRRENLHVRISEDLARDIRVAAAGRGMTMAALVTQMLKKFIPIELAQLREELNGRTEKP